MASVVSDFAFNLLYQVVTIIAPLITVPYISRIIGPEGIGIVSYTKSIADYFLLVAMLGMLNHGNRSIAALSDEPKNRSTMFWSLMTIQAITTLLATGFYLVYALSQAGDTMLLSRIYVLYVLSAFFNIEWYLEGTQQFKRLTVRNCAVKIISIIAIFLFVKSRSDLWLDGLIMAGSQLLSSLFLWPGAIRSVSFERPDPGLILKQIKPVLTLFLPTVAVSVYKYLDKILLGQLGSMEQVGFFDNAEKLINVILGISLAFNTVMLPRMARLAATQSGREQNRKIMLDSLVLMALISMPLAFGLIAVSEKMALILFGPAFLESGVLMAGMALTIPFICWGGIVRTQIILPYKMDIKLSLSLLAGAVINVTVNLLLIPHYGARGAVYGTIITEVLVCAIQMWMVRGDLDLRAFVRKGYFFLLDGLVMLLLLKFVDHWFKPSLISLAIEILLGAVIYLLPLPLYLKRTGVLDNYLRLLNLKAFKKKTEGGI